MLRLAWGLEREWFFFSDKEEHKCVGEEVATAAHESWQCWQASTLPLHDLHWTIDECEEGIIWQDSCNQLRRPNVGEAECKVLEARLTRLGISGDFGIPEDTPFYDDEGAAAPPDDGMKPEAWQESVQPLQTASVSHQEVAIGDELSNVLDVHSAMRRRDDAYIQSHRDSGLWN